METFFMNTKNSKTNEPNRFKYDLIDKFNIYLIDRFNFKNPNMALANLSIYYTWKNVKSIYNNNKFKISAPTWNETFDLPDGSYNISEIQDYIKIKSEYKLELLSNETMKLLESTKNIIDSDKNSENVPRSENVEVFLVHCNLANNSYQQHSRVLFTFVLAYQNVDDRQSYDEFYLPKVMVKDYNVIIDKLAFFDLPIKTEEEAYEKIIDISRNNEFTTGNLLDYDYFKKYYKLIAIDLSKQHVLQENEDLIQQINFIGKLVEAANVFIIIKKKENTILEFSQNFSSVIY